MITERTQDQEPIPTVISEQLHEPSYIDHHGDPWVGIEVDDGPFLFWRNFAGGDLTNDEGRHNTTAFITRLKVQHDIDAKIGFPIDLDSCNPISGSITKIDLNGSLGIYFPSRTRQLSNMRLDIDGLKSEEKLRADSPDEFEQVYQETLSTLPQI